MHELHLIRPALERALDREIGSRPSAVRLTIHDPARISPAAARFFAAELLRERGLRVPVKVSVDWVSCVLCEWMGVPAELHPYCPACGAPLPERRQPGVTVRVTRERSARCA